MFDTAAKAWVALLGAIVTALLGLEVIPIVGVWHTILTITSAILTAIITYQVPNKPAGILP